MPTERYLIRFSAVTVYHYDAKYQLFENFVLNFAIIFYESGFLKIQLILSNNDFNKMNSLR